MGLKVNNSLLDRDDLLTKEEFNDSILNPKYPGFCCPVCPEDETLRFKSTGYNYPSKQKLLKHMQYCHPIFCKRRVYLNAMVYEMADEKKLIKSPELLTNSTNSNNNVVMPAKIKVKMIKEIKF